MKLEVVVILSSSARYEAVNRCLIKVKTGVLIFLIGFMGSGKTTAGRMLAEKLGNTGLPIWMY
jgi:ABC-type oligopeptide transport system ATPase subunit